MVHSSQLAFILLGGVAMVVASMLAHADAEDVSPDAGQKIAWVSDLPAAARQAAEKQLLLMVIDLPGDFARNLPDSREARTYDHLALFKPDVRQTVNRQYVANYQQVGIPLLFGIHTGTNERSRKAVGTVTTFLCLPDQRVIDFWVGYLKPAPFQARLERTHTLSNEIRDLSEDQQRLRVSQFHQGRLVPEAIRLFQSEIATRISEKGIAEATIQDVQGVVAAGKAYRNNRLVAKFGANWAPAEQPALLRSLLDHADLEPDYAELILTEVPLAPLAMMRRIVSETLAGHSFVEVPPNRERIHAWWKKGVEQPKPILLMVGPLPDSVARPVKEEFAWPAKPLQEILKDFEYRFVTWDEFACLAIDANLPAMELQQGDLPRFLIFTDHAAQRKELPRGCRVTQLHQALKQALGDTNSKS